MIAKTKQASASITIRSTAWLNYTQRRVWLHGSGKLFILHSAPIENHCVCNEQRNGRKIVANCTHSSISGDSSFYSKYSSLLLLSKIKSFVVACVKQFMTFEKLRGVVKRALIGK
jgi:hypothetical protein